MDWIDRLNGLIGRLVAWGALVMTALTLVVVVLRYVFDEGTLVLQESVLYLHGIAFMLAIPWTLKQGGHVRVDLLYGRLDERSRARIDLAGHLLLLLPLAAFIVWTSAPYVAASWRILEGSPDVGGIPGIFLLKTLIPLMATLLFLQGLAEIARGVAAGTTLMFELIPLLLFLVVFAVLLSGYPVAISLGGVALLFALIGIATGHFHAGDLGFVPGRLFGIISNATLMAVPLFVFMGVVLEKTEIARELLGSLSARLRRIPGGLGITVVLVGALLAASTGIVGATVVTMGLMSLPSMLDDGYDPRLATGTISATGTLGQIIPPSISLVLLGDVLSNAYQQAQLSQGVFSPKTVSVGDLFAGALLPGLVLVMLYFVYVVSVAMLQPQRVGASRPLSGGDSHGHIVQSLVAPIVLILLVLGSILAGIATPTEAAGVGAAGALILAALKGRLSMTMLREVGESTVQTTAMVFFILVGASVFSLVFRGYGGDEVIGEVFASMPGGMWGALAVVMLVIFLLGFVLDFIEITFVVIPIVGPVLLAMGMDPVWLGILIAINLQTSFLTPPFGFALFYLRGVAPASVRTADMYRGVVPFVALQLVVLAMLCVWPALATWLPGLLNAGH